MGDRGRRFATATEKRRHPTIDRRCAGLADPPHVRALMLPYRCGAPPAPRRERRIYGIAHFEGGLIALRRADRAQSNCRRRSFIQLSNDFIIR
jgi:hypothetical protein